MTRTPKQLEALGALGDFTKDEFLQPQYASLLLGILPACST
jgi:hypothetical protein